jgi:hypothetical protein
MNNMPLMAAVSRSRIPKAAARLRSMIRCSGAMGCWACVSTTVNTVSSAAPARKAATVSGSLQPADAARMRP